MEQACSCDLRSLFRIVKDIPEPSRSDHQLKQQDVDAFHATMLWNEK
jgi:hypothetical protein